MKFWLLANLGWFEFKFELSVAIFCSLVWFGLGSGSELFVNKRNQQVKQNLSNGIDGAESQPNKHFNWQNVYKKSAEKKKNQPFWFRAKDIFKSFIKKWLKFRIFADGI